jgi:ADP-heptose:LPS heptosyltransferase
MKFLVSAYTGLGNFILKTPLIETLKDEFPGCQLDLIAGSPWSEEVIRGYQGISKLHWLSPQSSLIAKFRMLLRFRQESYDAVFLPFDATPLHLLFGIHLISKPRAVVTHFMLQSISWKMNLVTLISILIPGQIQVPVLKGRHEIDLNLDLLEYYLKRPIKRNFKTKIYYAEQNVKRKYSLDRPYIVVQLSARHGMATPKTWALENFVTLFGKFHARYPDYLIVLVGTESEKRKLSDRGVPKFAQVVNLMGETSFSELCSVVKNVAVVISHDSGLMHISNALEVPMIALYGPTDITRTRPLAKSTVILQSQNDCCEKMYGFNDSETKLAREYPEGFCMSGIYVDEVFENLERLLS